MKSNRKLLFKNVIYVFAIVILNVTISFAQPDPCGPNPIMANTCLGACVICDIDGYTGVNDLQDNGQNLGNIFCSFADDMHFIAFIAGSTSLEIQIDVSNCTTQGGQSSLDIGIYESTDCNNFTPITPCEMDVANGDSHVFVTDVPLVVGQYYYIVMDGSSGSICNWTFSVLQGTTQVDLLEESGDIIGELNPCMNQPVEFEVDFPVGASDFLWTVNDEDINMNAAVINYEFTELIPYELCVTSRNACDNAPPTCVMVNPLQVPETFLLDSLCQNECFIYEGVTICDPGQYEFVLEAANGCDSLIFLELSELAISQVFFDVNICDGDTIFLGDTPYTETGMHQKVFTNVLGCDSIVNLDLNIIFCNIMGEDEIVPVICNGTPSGTINFNINNGTPPFNYTYLSLNNSLTGSGTISALGENITIEDLLIGTYIVTVEDNFGNSFVIVSEVTEPPVLVLDFDVSDYNGVNVSCANSVDGFLQLNAVGGVEPYNYMWSQNGTDAMIDGLSGGVYSVSFTDDVGCLIIREYTLVAPDTLDVAVSFNDGNCDGINTGYVELDPILGGVTPYQFYINGELIDSTLLVDNLGFGDYQMEIVDANGCTEERMGMIDIPEIPIVELGNDISFELGESTILYPIINDVTVDNLLWYTEDNINCDTCLNPTVMPMQSGYYVFEVTSIDGCQRSDSLFIEIIDKRNVFIPNIFTPNFDGTNDFFTVFGEMPNVQEVEQFVVFDRWGGQVFNQKNFLPNDLSKGWDGSANGTNLDNGVYVYMAKIRFWDNKVLVYKGDISLVR